MINLREVPSKDMAKLLTLIKKREAIERQMAEILKKATKRKLSASIKIRNLRMPRNAQPSLRDLITGILKKAAMPMSASEIYRASIDAGYRWQSRQPLNALNVKLYTDKTFKKVAPGRFALRIPKA